MTAQIKLVKTKKNKQTKR